ncbi:hypothetical protein GGQ91_004284 [Methylobacterium fujisawaense]|uniref:Uncharacterized protein n=1 Tax=Methylobacterium fujisawaense TaxID=107400 RepID=A0ABR6DGI1_9HYPH|nr:hypothetical protein [Methylobacterium fujisawaense]
MRVRRSAGRSRQCRRPRSAPGCGPGTARSSAASGTNPSRSRPRSPSRVMRAPSHGRLMRPLPHPAARARPRPAGPPPARPAPRPVPHPDTPGTVQSSRACFSTIIPSSPHHGDERGQLEAERPGRQQAIEAHARAAGQPPDHEPRRRHLEEAVVEVRRHLRAAPALPRLVPGAATPFPPRPERRHRAEPGRLRHRERVGHRRVHRLDLRRPQRPASRAPVPVQQSRADRVVPAPSAFRIADEPATGRQAIVERHQRDRLSF